MSFTVDQGEWVTMLGSNGAGKTTLLRALRRYADYDGGEVLLDGRRLRDMSDRSLSASVYLVPQDSTRGIAPLLSVRENLVVASSSRSQGGWRNDEKIMELLGSAGMSPHLGQLANTLSGGQRQVLALAMAKLQPAPLVLLDEPLAALDTRNEGLARSAISDLHAAGKTIVQVTHNVREAVDCRRRALVLAGGVVALDGVPTLEGLATAISPLGVSTC